MIKNSLKLLFVSFFAISASANLNTYCKDGEGKCPYNILSLDAGIMGYYGYITAKFLEYMEGRAYNIARRDKCYPEDESHKLPMPYLFDFLAGSETGAYIATSLVLPAKDDGTGVTKPKQTSEKAVKFFEENVGLYRDNSLGAFWYFLIIIIVIASLCYLAHRLINRYFIDEGFDKRYQEFVEIIEYF